MDILQDASVTASMTATEGWTSLGDDERVHGSLDSRLVLRQVSESDAGTYRCQVTNMAGTAVSSAVELVVGACV